MFRIYRRYLLHQHSQFDIVLNHSIDKYHERELVPTVPLMLAVDLMLFCKIMC